MINTPICDFVARYAIEKAVRLHMPGHKGTAFIGPEAFDITEIPGADVLYDSNGIIQASQENARALFGTGKTLYSAEGSSLCIRAMIHLILMHAKATGRRPLIAAARNAHKVFITACALLNAEVVWLYPAENSSVVSCPLELSEVERVLKEQSPAALYITSPDYLGQLADLSALSALCRQYGTLLAVDNAHGAYLHFLKHPVHPMDLGADLCCDSAHKTLPVLTGGAYLHIALHAPETLFSLAENAMKLFASTSPSYLILQSLDRCNAFLDGEYRSVLDKTIQRLNALKQQLLQQGWTLCSQEPLKLTIAPKAMGYTGEKVAEKLQARGIYCEFADPDFLVMMFTPQTDASVYALLADVFASFPQRESISTRPPALKKPVACLSPREALLSLQECIPAQQAAGRVLASPSVTCPPAVPIVVCGEQVDGSAAACFAYYGVENLWVVREADTPAPGKR